MTSHRIFRAKKRPGGKIELPTPQPSEQAYLDRSITGASKECPSYARVGGMQCHQPPRVKALTTPMWQERTAQQVRGRGLYGPRRA